MEIIGTKTFSLWIFPRYRAFSRGRINPIDLPNWFLLHPLKTLENAATTFLSIFICLSKHSPLLNHNKTLFSKKEKRKVNTVASMSIDTEMKNKTFLFIGKSNHLQLNLKPKTSNFCRVLKIKTTGKWTLKQTNKQKLKLYLCVELNN